MLVKEIAEVNNWKLLAGSTGTDREVKNCYICDLLSWAMSRAQEDDLWITVMGNVNAVAVASLTDVAAIVLADNAPLDEEARLKAEQQGIAVYSCEENIFEAAMKVYNLMKA